MNSHQDMSRCSEEVCSQSDSQAQVCLTGRVTSVGSVPGDSGAALFSLFSFPARLRGSRDSTFCLAGVFDMCLIQ